MEVSGQIFPNIVTRKSSGVDWSLVYSNDRRWWRCSVKTHKAYAASYGEVTLSCREISWCSAMTWQSDVTGQEEDFEEVCAPHTKYGNFVIGNH